MMPPPPDPVMQAIIDASFKPVDLVLAEENSVLLCGPHKLEKCDSCNVDYASLNRISRLLINNPNLLCPPPAKVVNPQMSQAINKTKDEGNVRWTNNSV
jgi:translocation protein SEC72